MAPLCGLLALVSCSRAERDSHPPQPRAPSSALPATPTTVTDPFDAVMAEHWQHHHVDPVQPSHDAEFLRRVSLDLIGRIPTPNEVERFLRSNEPDKRVAVIDELLTRDTFAAHWAEIFAEMLVGAAVDQRRRLHQSLVDWLKRQLGNHRPWDEITTDLLTASEELDPGAAVFLTTHGRGNQVEALTGQTARVFLGLQLQCAQCHDDPDHRFTQREFYGLAAYYARTRARIAKVDGVPTARVFDKPRGQMRMPSPSDSPGDRTGPRVDPSFAALQVEPRSTETRRQTMARGIVGSALFAKAAVNHAWFRMMGRGIVEPWDDLGHPTAPDHPALLAWLANDFTDHGHDLRQLLRRIARSKAYQLSSRGPSDGAEPRVQHFAQAAVRPMTPPQLVRSLLVATGLDDTANRAFRREVDRRRPQIQREFAQVFDDDATAAADALSDNVPRALLLLNGELTNQGIAAPHGALAGLLETYADPAERIDALFVRIYGHHPSESRRTELLAFVERRAHTPAAYADLMHAMLLSSEFLTIH